MGKHSTIFNRATGEENAYVPFFTVATAVSQPILDERAEALRIAAEEQAALEKEELERTEAIHDVLEQGGISEILRAMLNLPDVNGMNFSLAGPFDHFYTTHDISLEIRYDHTRFKSWGRRGECPRDAIEITIHQNGEVDIKRYDRPVKSDKMLAYEEALKQVREGEIDPSKAPSRKVQPAQAHYSTLREAVDNELADFVGSVVPDRVDELKQKMIEMQEPPQRKLGRIRGFIARFQR